MSEEGTGAALTRTAHDNNRAVSAAAAAGRSSPASCVLSISHGHLTTSQCLPPAPHPTSKQRLALSQTFSSSLGSSSASTKGRDTTVAISYSVMPASAHRCSSAVVSSSTRTHSGRRLGSSLLRSSLSAWGHAGRCGVRCEKCGRRENANQVLRPTCAWQDCVSGGLLTRYQPA